ncbi:hypothetical protein B296_00023359, partial [Ensete ventricosum]
SSSSILAGADAKALQALEAMKSTHDARQSSNWMGVFWSCFLDPDFNTATPASTAYLYTLLSEVLMDGAAKAMVLVPTSVSSASGPTPGVEIELDPFASLPEDDDVPMADEQPFDDSLPSPEE